MLCAVSWRFGGERKGSKREFSVGRTPQQNEVLLKGEKYDHYENRVLVVKPHNKTPYELFRGKFDGKSDEGFFVGYSLNSKAFRVYNIITRKVEENLHIRFLEDKPIIVGDGPKWLFDIDVLTKSMNYVPVVAGTNSNDLVVSAGSVVPTGKDNSIVSTGSTKVIPAVLYNLNRRKDLSRAGPTSGIRAWRESLLKKLYFHFIMTSQNPSQTYPMPSPSVSSFTFPSTTEPVFSASTSEPVFESPNSQTSQNTQSQQQFQQYHTTTVSNNNAKFPYLKKDEYETWAMKMEYWIMNSDHNLWNIVLNGNSRKKTGRDPKGNIMILPPVSVEEHIAVQRETKARTILLQSLPEDHMADFHHLDDARDIWFAVKARFQKILSQLNQMQAKSDNEDCNMKFLRALPPSWTLEIDVKGGSSYDSRGISAPTHSAFISAASTNSKLSFPQSHSTTFTSASSSPTASSNVMENVLHSFVAESDPQQ
ncbi:hypothetical protein Tco_0409614 [Tanacetum coccineum]